MSCKKKLLKELPDCAELVMTGRDPLDYMIESSDYWSDLCRTIM